MREGCDSGKLRARGAFGALALALGLASACQSTVPFDAPGLTAVTPDDTPPPVSTDGPARAEAAPPVVAITSPTMDAALTEAPFVVEGTSSDDGGVASVFVGIGPNAPRLATTTDGFRTWTLEATAPLGHFTVTATAYDTVGNTASQAIVVSRGSTAGDTTAPTLTITEPADGSTPPRPTVLVRGTTSDDTGVVRMTILRDGEALAAPATDDFFATWASRVSLLPGITNVLHIKACDEAGNCAVETLSLVGPAALDTEAPVLTVSTPSAGDAVDTDALTVRGTATDNVGLREVKVRYASGACDVATDFGPFAPTTSSDAFAHFDATLPIGSGTLCIEVRAVDVSGLVTSELIELTNAWSNPWSTEALIPLRTYAPTAPPEMRAELDRTGVDAVIDTATQQSLRLLGLDPTALVTNALTAIRSACDYDSSTASCTGTPDWQKNMRNPVYNCACTGLGQSFGTSWQFSPEFRLVRLLTMTPANVEVSGTSIADLEQLANDWGIGGGFNKILSDMTGVPLTSPFLRISDILTGLVGRFMRSHPYLTPASPSDPVTIPVTLYDAMHDMAPLGDSLGPSASGHPGVLDPALPPYANVLGTDFRMLIVALSNLAWHDGVELARGKDYIALVEDTTGPTYNDVLEFDFLDPTRFDITGLVASPTLDLRMRLNEHPTFVSACGGSLCRWNLPSTPYGTSYVWSQPPWELENIITYSAVNRFRTRTFSNCYVDILVACLADASVSNPGVANSDGVVGGWTVISTTFNVGNPPPDQYMWELLDEVSQVALHRVGSVSGVIPEGQANPAFTLTGIPIGITAADIKAAVRPTLEAQKSQLSAALLGNYAANNGAVDFYLVRGDLDANALFLFFTDPTDPTPQPYTHPAPGFFADEALTQEISATTLAGTSDTVHAKLLLPPAGGQAVVYATDPTGKLYRLRLFVPSDPSADVELRLAHRL